MHIFPARGVVLPIHTSIGALALLKGLGKLDIVETSCAIWPSSAPNMQVLVLKSTPAAAGDEKPEKNRWASLVPEVFLEPDLVLSKQPGGAFAGQHSMNI